MLHIDIKKLGRIVRPSHRVTRNRRDSVDGAGWETLFVAIDDPARLAFTAMHLDEKQAQAVLFLKNAVAYYPTMGVIVQRLLTDNGPAFCSREFRHVCERLRIKHRFMRPYRPQTNGKAERFISQPCESGPTVGHTKTRPSALLRWRTGNTTKLPSAA